MVKLTPPLTINQQIAISIIPKFTASLSMLGSGYIIHHVLSSRNRRRRVYHRVLLGMALTDVLSSFKSFLSTWPSPRGTAWGAVGTTGTCSAFGFLGHGASLAGTLYNGSLALYYFLTICNRTKWREERLRPLEKFLHAVPLVTGWSTAIAALPLKLFNPIGWTCWIGPLPMGCKQTYEWGFTTCDRGDNSYIYRWAFFHGELWITFFLTFVGMVRIYRAVRRREQMTELPPSAARRGSDELRRSLRRTKKHSRRVMGQAALFLAAFYLTWIFPAVTWTTQLAQGKTYTIILFLQAIFVPLQGAFNAMIYLRPRYLRNREQHPDERLRSVLRRTLKSEAPHSTSANRSGNSAETFSGGASTWLGDGFKRMLNSFSSGRMGSVLRKDKRDNSSSGNCDGVPGSTDGNALEDAGLRSTCSSVNSEGKEEWKFDDEVKASEPAPNDNTFGSEEGDICEELVD